MLFRDPAQLGQHHRHHVLKELRIAPEKTEGLREKLPLIGFRDEARMQRPVEIIAGREPGRLHRPHRIDHPARPHRQPGLSQRPREMHDIGGELAVFGDGEIGELDHLKSPD